MVWPVGVLRGDMSKQALEGIKVADFTWIAAGPVTTKYLADHGATVVRVESTTKPDHSRGWPPFKGGEPGINRSGFYADFNASKYNLTINLNNAAGRAVARKLVKWADVFVENYTPGVMDKLGLGYPAAAELNPAIVYLSSSQQGRGGPHYRHSGYGNHAASISGFTHVTGQPGEEGMMPYGAYTDFISPRFSVVAILAALEFRRRTGKGQYIDLAQVESGLQFLAPMMMDEVVNRKEFHRHGNRDLNASPHGAYPCRGEDRWCVIAVFTDDQWRALRKVMGDPSWACEARFSTLEGRKANEDELDGLISQWTRDYSPEEVMIRLQKAGVAGGIVATGEDMFRDPQLKHREQFVALEHPEMGLHHYDGLSFKLSGTPGRLRSPAPLIGQHNDYVLRKLLGMDDEEVAEAAEAGALD